MQVEQIPDNTPGYYLPEEAQLQLQQVRDRLELLAALVMPAHHRGDAGEALSLRRSALAHCFDQLAGEMAQALATVHWRG